MKAKTYNLLHRCIDEGIESALINSDITFNEQYKLASAIANCIWLELDNYFNFDETTQ